MTPPKKRRLGRGLDGLLPAAPTRAATTKARIEELRPGASQPRRRFDEQALLELADSIRTHGMLEPILVRKEAGNDGYEIIAGERRWRAAQKAGLKEVPIFVRELGDEAAFEAALVENLQREDLNPIETARAFQRLIEEFGHSQEDVAQRVGKDRSTIANALRILKLPPTVLESIEVGELSEGHGRALLQAADVPSMEKLAREAIARRLSVRDVERRARQGRDEAGRRAANGGSAGKSANVRDLERRLSDALGTTVTVEDQGGKGALSVRYSSWDELDRLIQLFESRQVS